MTMFLRDKIRLQHEIEPVSHVVKKDNAVVVVIPDPHSHPDFGNERASWLGEMIFDIKPDAVVCLGDLADMPSLASQSKGKLSFVGARYSRDVNAALDFQDRLWHPFRKNKKRLPPSFFIVGNHERRIARFVDENHTMQGFVSMSDLELDFFWDEVVHYHGSTPGVLNLNGVNYSHFFVTGTSNLPISGATIGRTLLQKKHVPTTVGHSHLLSYDLQRRADGSTIQGLSAGCFQDYDAPWAGQSSHLWWRGVVVKTFVDHGHYDPQFVSLERLRRAYSD